MKITPNNPKDWPEDFSHENGNYTCHCIKCGFSFRGHKRRVVCKECAAIPNEPKIKKVYKYQLKLANQQIINLPGDWNILTVQSQNGILTMWVVVGVDSPEVEVCIAIYGTGQEMRNINQRYLSTVQMDNGLVWHIFIVD